MFRATSPTTGPEGQGPGHALYCRVDHSRSVRWGASLGGRIVPGTWSRHAANEGMYWKDLWLGVAAQGVGGSEVKAKLVLIRMDSFATLSSAIYSAGRSPVLTALARRLNEVEI